MPHDEPIRRDAPSDRDAPRAAAGPAAAGAPRRFDPGVLARRYPFLRPTAAYGHLPPIPLHKPITLVGSRKTARIHLNSPSVSRAHALLIVTPTGLFVHDLQSRGGTLVNGEGVREIDLHDGDELQIAGFTFRVGDPRPIDPDARPPRIAPSVLRLETPKGQRTVDLVARVTLVGRRPGSDVHLPFNDVSTANTAIVRLEGFSGESDSGGFVGYALYDLGGKGTRLNGRPVHKGAFGPGDVVMIGSTRIRLAPAPALHASTPRPVAPPPPASAGRGRAASPGDTGDALSLEEDLLDGGEPEDLLAGSAIFGAEFEPDPAPFEDTAAFEAEGSFARAHHGPTPPTASGSAAEAEVDLPTRGWRSPLAEARGGLRDESQPPPQAAPQPEAELTGANEDDEDDDVLPAEVEVVDPVAVEERPAEDLAAADLLDEEPQEETAPAEAAVAEHDAGEAEEHVPPRSVLDPSDVALAAEAEPPEPDEADEAVDLSRLQFGDAADEVPAAEAEPDFALEIEDEADDAAEGVAAEQAAEQAAGEGDVLPARRRKGNRRRRAVAPPPLAAAAEAEPAPALIGGESDRADEPAAGVEERPPVTNLSSDGTSDAVLEATRPVPDSALDLSDLDPSAAAAENWDAAGEVLPGDSAFEREVAALGGSLAGEIVDAEPDAIDVVDPAEAAGSEPEPEVVEPLADSMHEWQTQHSAYLGNATPLVLDDAAETEIDEPAEASFRSRFASRRRR